MNKKICIYAGIFVAAMFLLTAIPTNAITVQELEQLRLVQAQQQQAQAQLAQQGGVFYEDEPYSFPAQLPPGTSSLSCITKRRASDFWNMCIYDVGFSFWTMQLRDGPAHWLNFAGTITVVWHQGQAPENINYPLPENWANWVFGGVSFYRGGTYLFPQPFYTATVHGWIYKDMGDPEYKTRDLTGYNYYLENNLLNNPLVLV